MSWPLIRGTPSHGGMGAIPKKASYHRDGPISTRWPCIWPSALLPLPGWGARMLWGSVERAAGVGTMIESDRLQRGCLPVLAAVGLCRIRRNTVQIRVTPSAAKVNSAGVWRRSPETNRIRRSRARAGGPFRSIRPPHFLAVVNSHCCSYLGQKGLWPVPLPTSACELSAGFRATRLDKTPPTR